MLTKISDEKLTSIIENGQVITGRILRISPGGYGFISTEEIPFTKIFFHWSALESTTKHFTELRVGEVVQFEVIEYEGKGLRAIKIVVK